MTQNHDQGPARIDEDDLSSAERAAVDDAVAGGSDAASADELGEGVNPPDDDPDTGPEAEEADRDNRLPGG